MSIKVLFLNNHLVRFPENARDVSDEQKERFHLDISDMEVRYQGRGMPPCLQTIVGLSCEMIASHSIILEKRQFIADNVYA